MDIMSNRKKKCVISGQQAHHQQCFLIIAHLVVGQWKEYMMCVLKSHCGAGNYCLKVKMVPSNIKNHGLHAQLWLPIPCKDAGDNSQQSVPMPHESSGLNSQLSISHSFCKHLWSGLVHRRAHSLRLPASHILLSLFIFLMKRQFKKKAVKDFCMIQFMKLEHSYALKMHLLLG